jgi:hypothetical protein
MRTRLGVLLLGLMLSAPACGGRHGSASVIPPAVTVPTVKSVSPALIAAPPMAKTAILPASAMTSIRPVSAMTSVRRPKSAIQPFNWAQITGGAIFVAAGPDGSIWVLSNQGAGPDQAIWHYASGGWSNISGGASRLAVAPDQSLWAVTAAGGIYHYVGGSWSTIGGGATDISVGPDGSVYIISNQGGGPFGRGAWRYAGGTWTQLPGGGVRVAASWDSGTYLGTITPGSLWVLNTPGDLWYYNAAFGFHQLGGGGVEMAPTTNGGIFVLGFPAGAGGYPIWYNDLNTGTWTPMTGGGVSIATDGKVLWAVGTAGGIWFTPVTPVAPPPVASIAVAGPPANPHVTGSPSTGYQLIGNQPYTFTAKALDGAGNPITGPGAPAWTVRSSSNALVVTPLAGDPNAFTVRARRFSSTPVIVTFSASNSSTLANVAFTTIQELWVANAYNSTITGYAGQPPTQILSDTITSSSGIQAPVGIAFDDYGRMWVANYGKVTVFAGSTASPADTITAGLTAPSALAFDPSGTLWVANWPQSGTGSVNSYAGTALLPGIVTNPDSSLTGLWGPKSLAFDAAGNLWVANGGGNVSTVTAYSGTTQLTASTITGVAAPGGIAFDGSGALWVSSSYPANTVNPYSGSTLIYGNTITSGLNQPAGIAFDAIGNLWVANSSTGVNGSTITAYSGTSQITGNTISAGINGPIALTFAPPATLPAMPPPPHPSPPPAPVIANPTSVAFSVVGSGFARVYYAQAGYFGDYSMTNSNPSVASAEQVGASTTVRPLSNGTTTLHVTAGFGQSVDVPVTVQTGGAVVVSPSSLTFTNIGPAYSQTVAVSQANYNGSFTPYVFDPTVVSISISGNTVTITPLNSGSTVVRVGGGSSQFGDVSVGVTISNVNIHATRRGVR